jgi:rubredoxin
MSRFRAPLACDCTLSMSAMASCWEMIPKSTMTNVSTIAPSGMRCPRCQSRTTVQNAIELRPGVEYLTLRCISCGLIYNAQVPSNQNGLHDIGPQNENVPLG